MENQNSKIEAYLQGKYPKKLVQESGNPIGNSIHCCDIMVDKVEVRLRHFSPFRGTPSGFFWHIVTPEQAEQKKVIEKQFRDKANAKRKSDEELGEWQRERMRY